MFPKMAGRRSQTLTIPELSGGINLRDGASLIQDNQLLDSLNMYYEGGLLKTRPPLNFLQNPNVSFLDNLNDFKVVNVEGSAVISGIEYAVKGFIAGGKAYFYGISLTRKKEVKRFGTITPDDNCSITNCVAFIFDGYIYCFCTYSKDGSESYEIYKIDMLNRHETNVLPVAEEEIYTPLVMTNCKPNSPEHLAEDTKEAMLDRGATQIEGYNLLSGYYKMEFSTVEEDSEENTPMMYTLWYDAHNDGNFIGQTVTAKITDIEGNTYTHKVTISKTNVKDGEWDLEQTSPGDNLYMGVNGRRLRFYEGASNGSIKNLTPYDFVRNNMIVTAPCPHSDEDMKKIFGMSFAKWFGGEANGLYGGTRVFLGGNVNEKEKSLIAWCDLNNPLYFSENNYAYAGDKSSRVNAFGRQADKLIVFKDTEIYSVRYERMEGATASDFINQSVLDMSASVAYFPITQLHGDIGCDCPDSVQLCRNRLVWMCSNGKVYTLVTNNQYSESNVYELSSMVENRLKLENREDLKNVVSCDYNGKYMLFVGSSVYAMDYNSYGFSHVYSYSKTEDANLHLPWWYWKLPLDAKEDNGAKLYNKVFAVDAGFDTAYIHMMAINEIVEGAEKGIERETKGFLNLGFFDKSIKQDRVREMIAAEDGGNSNYHDYVQEPTWYSYDIDTMIKTKAFDFSSPSVSKSANSIDIVFGSNDGLPIKISYFTEKAEGLDETIFTINENVMSNLNNNYLQNRHFLPCVRFFGRLGMKLECKGQMAIDSITLNFRWLGGIR